MTADASEAEQRNRKGAPLRRAAKPLQQGANPQHTHTETVSLCSVPN